MMMMIMVMKKLCFGAIESIAFIFITTDALVLGNVDLFASRFWMTTNTAFNLSQLSQFITSIDGLAVSGHEFCTNLRLI